MKAAFLALVLAVTSTGAISSPSIKTGSITSIPIGHINFCQKFPCGYHDDSSKIDYLDRTVREEIEYVNFYVNTTVQPVTDLDLYGVDELWTYPVDGFGDCEDYALQKKKFLMERGFHPANLRLAAVYTQSGEGHLVLVVQTNFGDLVLDNLDNSIKFWNETGYDFIKIQDRTVDRKWLEVRK